MSASLSSDSFAFRSALPLSPPALSHCRLLVHLGSVSITRRQGSIRGSVMKGFAGFGRSLAAGLPTVRLVIEIAEEDDEGEGVSNQTPVHPLRERAVRVQRQSRVANGDMKLDLRKKIKDTSV